MLTEFARRVPVQFREPGTEAFGEACGPNRREVKPVGEAFIVHPASCVDERHGEFSLQ